MTTNIAAETVYREVIGQPEYRVGDDGSVWSCLNRGGSGAGCHAMTDRWHQLDFHPAKGGYLRVRLRRRLRMVHHLVLEAFIGPCPDGMEARHYPDHDPTNNRLTNLQWGTPIANARDRDEQGRTARGSRSGGAKLKEEQIPVIRRLRAEGKLIREIAAIYGVGCSTIDQIFSGRSWRHIGG